ncbi:hypothetical protein BH09SUM1_BH09SUM1_08470 [soil metagenome]
MAAKKSNSSVVVIAGVLAFLIAAALAAFSFFGASDKKPVAKPVVATASETPSASPADPPTPTPTPAPPAVHVHGVVRNADAAPEAKQEIYIVEKTAEKTQDSVQKAFLHPDAVRMAITNEKGEFEADVEPKKTWIVGLLIGGEPQDVVQEVAGELSPKPIEVALSVPAVYELRGSVSLPSGEVLEGVPVIIDWRPHSLLEKTPDMKHESVSTSLEGRFSINLRELTAATVTVDTAALPEPYLYGRQPIKLGPEEFGAARTYRVDLEVVEGITVTGVVNDEVGKPVSGAEVRLAPVSIAGATDLVGATDAAGKFSVPMVYPRVYTLSVKKQGYNTFFHRELDAAAAGEQAITLDRHASIAGGVRLDGVSVLSAKVSLIDLYGGHQDDATFGADGTAPFTFKDVEPGDYMLAAEAQRNGVIYYAEKRLKIEGSATGEAGELVLHPLGSLKGQMIGTPPAGGYTGLAIHAAPLNSDANDFPLEAARSSWRRIPFATTSDAGAFALENLIDGVSYLITVQNRATGQLIGGAVGSVGLAEAVRVSLDGVGTVTGRVLNPRGEACSGETIRLVTGLGALEGAVPDIQDRQTTTTFDGAYRFLAVPVGQARIGVGADTLPLQLLSVRTGDETIVDLACLDYVTITFEIHAGQDHPFQSGEQFLVLPQAGTDTTKVVRELTMNALRARLEPGKYIITRTATMESRSFEVNPRLDGPVSIDFAPKSP